MYLQIIQIIKFPVNYPQGIFLIKFPYFPCSSLSVDTVSSSIFSKLGNIFRNFKSELLTQIPASNDKNAVWHSSRTTHWAHDVATILNQRHWGWFNVATTWYAQCMGKAYPMGLEQWYDLETASYTFDPLWKVADFGVDSVLPFLAAPLPEAGDTVHHPPLASVLGHLAHQGPAAVPRTSVHTALAEPGAHLVHGDVVVKRLPTHLTRHEGDSRLLEHVRAEEVRLFDFAPPDGVAQRVHWQLVAVVRHAGELVLLGGGLLLLLSGHHRRGTLHGLAQLDQRQVAVYCLDVEVGMDKVRLRFHVLLRTLVLGQVVLPHPDQHTALPAFAPHAVGGRQYPLRGYEYSPAVLLVPACCHCNLQQQDYHFSTVYFCGGYFLLWLELLTQQLETPRQDKNDFLWFEFCISLCFFYWICNC